MCFMQELQEKMLCVAKMGPKCKHSEADRNNKTKDKL